MAWSATLVSRQLTVRYRSTTPAYEFEELIRVNADPGVGWLEQQAARRIAELGALQTWAATLVVGPIAAPPPSPP